MRSRPCMHDVMGGGRDGNLEGECLRVSWPIKCRCDQRFLMHRLVEVVLQLSCFNDFSGQSLPRHHFRL